MNHGAGLDLVSHYYRLPSYPYLDNQSTGDGLSATSRGQCQCIHYGIIIKGSLSSIKIKIMLNPPSAIIGSDCPHAFGDYSQRVCIIKSIAIHAEP